MNNEIEVIHQDPLRLLVTLDVTRTQLLLFFQTFDQAITDRLILPFIVTMTNHEEICKGRYSGDIQNHDLFAFLAVNGLADFLEDCLGSLGSFHRVGICVYMQEPPERGSPERASRLPQSSRESRLSLWQEGSG